MKQVGCKICFLCLLFTFIIRETGSNVFLETHGLLGSLFISPFLKITSLLHTNGNVGRVITNNNWHRATVSGNDRGVVATQRKYMPHLKETTTTQLKQSERIKGMQTQNPVIQKNQKPVCGSVDRTQQNMFIDFWFAYLSLGLESKL